MSNNHSYKSLEYWIWDAACIIRGEPDVPQYKHFIHPLISFKRSGDVLFAIDEFDIPFDLRK